MSMSDKNDEKRDPRLDLFLNKVESWYEDNRLNDRTVRTNTINVGLIVSNMARDGMPITEDRLVSDKGSQVRGLSGTAIRKILAKHGETRKSTSEGGRTSRGTLPKAEDLVERLNAVEVDELDPNVVGDYLESYFVRKAQVDFFDKQRIKVEINPASPVSRVVGQILKAAALRDDKPTGAVLQHLVGAKLELRFPQVKIGRDKANTADLQTGRDGDFQINSTAFHVTVAPMDLVMHRCAENLSSGMRPVLIVPANRVVGARQNAEDFGIATGVNIIEAESFIGSNVEELAVFDAASIKEGLARLIRRYNERISEVETDMSFKIEEPAWFKNVLNES